MIESIKELRKICQESKYGVKNPFWPERIFYRSISIYFTKTFLKIGISANQATLISFFIGVIIGGSFFAFGNPKYWIAGALMFYLSKIVDRVDGEIARYNNLASVAGEYWDDMCGLCIGPYRMACMTFGIYGLFHAIPVLIFGFIAVTAPLFSRISNLLAYKLELPLQTLVNEDDTKTKKSLKQTLSRYVGLSFESSISIIVAILAVAMIDLYFNVVTIDIPLIGSFMINARYIYIIFYGVSILMVTVFRVYDIIRKGAMPNF